MILPARAEIGNIEKIFPMVGKKQKPAAFSLNIPLVSTLNCKGKTTLNSFVNGRRPQILM
jgi:hypothetical protein